MLIINKPEELIEVQCHRCKRIMKAHPMANIMSDYYTICELHNCKHESDDMIYTSHPPKNKCKKCGEFYR